MEEIDTAVEVFSLLADATRVRLILALRGGERSVSDLVGELERPQAAVSQHLARLRVTGIVTARRDGHHVHYRLADEHALAIIDHTLLQAEHVLDPHPAHHVRTDQGGNDA